MPRKPLILYDENEEDLPADCELTIIDPYIPLEETEYTKEERQMIAQFPTTDAAYDEVVVARTEQRMHAIVLSRGLVPVSKPFRSRQFWCVRVKHSG